MSSTPASECGWLPTTPTECPPSRAKPQTMFSAKRSCTSRNSPSSTTRRMTSLMSYGFVGSSGMSVSSSGSSRSGGSVGREVRRRIEVVLRQERQEVARVLEAGLLVRSDEMGDTGLGGVRGRPAELLERHLLPGHRLHHVGAGDEHVRGALDHEHEVRHRGRVDGAAGGRPHHQADLRDHAGGLHVPPEDLRVAGQRDDALLDPRAARVVDADHRAAELGRQVHDLADLLGERLGQAAAEDREVLREDEDLAAEDRPVAGHDGIAVRPPLHHPEVRVAVAHEAVELDERAGIEELLEPLVGEQLPLRPLALDRLLGAGWSASSRSWFSSSSLSWVDSVRSSVAATAGA